MRAMTNFRFCSLSTSQPSPQLSSVPGWKFSTSTSDTATRRLRISAPSGFLRSRVAAFLLRLSCKNRSPSPLFVMVPNVRRASPTFGNSILMTSAPNSPSCVAQNGPARKLDASMTRTPCSGLMAELDVGSSAMLWVSVALPLFASGCDALSRLQDAPCAINNGVVDKLAFKLDRGRTRCLGSFKGLHYPARPIDLLSGRGKDCVDDRHLIRVDAQFSLEAEVFDVPSGIGEALSICQVGPDRVYRRLNLGSTGSQDAFAAIGQQLGL